MKNYRKYHLGLVSQATLVLAMSAIPTIANAQTTAAESAQSESVSDNAAGANQSNSLGVIIVTARRVEENLQDVPISVSVFTGEQLVEQGAIRVQDTTQFTSNARMRAQATDYTTPQINFRGQIQPDNLATLDPAVGIYVDGFYWARSYGANADLLDVSRVEVLKGPQGTLFGRNTTGGALNIATNDPNFRGISGSLSGGLGNFGNQEFTAVVNAPIVDDRLALRAAVARRASDGYGRELISGNRHFGYESWSGRAKLLFQASEALEILLSAEFFDFDGDSPGAKVIFAQPGSLGDRVAVNISGGTDSITNYVGGDPFEPRLDNLPDNDTKTQTFVGKTTYDFGSATATAILGYRRIDSVRILDVDATPFPIVNTNAFANGDEFTAEFQLSGQAFDNRLSWTTGLYYFTESVTDGTNSLILRSVSGNFDQRTLGIVDNDSVGVYGQASFKITDRLTFTGGLRWSRDHRELISRNQTANAAGAITCSVPVVLRADPAICSASFSRNDSAVSYTASAQYEFIDDSMIYVKTSRGFRAGGFNLRGSGTVESFTPFKPETVTDYEGGLKMELFNRRLRLNGALFYSDYSDIQRNAIVMTSTGALGSLINNAAKAHIWGGEIEAQAVLFDGFKIYGALGITLPKYDSFIDFTGDRSGERFEYTSRYTGALGASYTRPTSFGSIGANIDYSYTSKYNLPRNTRPPFTEAPEYSVVNVRTSVNLDEPDIEVALYARNLFQKTYITQLQDLSSLGLITAQYGTPREYGFQITFKFGNQ